MMVSAGKGSFVDDVLAAVGAENVFGDVDRPWPTVGEEAIAVLERLLYGAEAKPR